MEAKAKTASRRLREYRGKRDFEATPEPGGKGKPARPELAVVPPLQPAHRRFCVQQHSASRPHYDLRLEINGVLKSWAVPKGPSLDPEVKRLAMATEDHPLDYLTFEGTIPAGSYGAGEVIVWDVGEYEPVGDTPPLQQWERGHVKFRLTGKKLQGEFALAYMAPRAAESAEANESAPAPENAWLLIKKRDQAARFGDTAERHPGSVLKPLGGRSRATAANPSGLHVVTPPAAAQLRPMLATLSTQPFRDPAWWFELKWDGIRAFAHCRNGHVTLTSRSERDLSRQYPELAHFPGELDAVLDGEIVALDADGKPSFHRLQRRMNLTGKAAIARMAEQVPVAFYAFDLLALGGDDLTRLPLAERKQKLQALPWEGPWRFSDHVVGDGVGLYQLAAERGLEGVVGKRADSQYEAGRSRAWRKFKLQQRQDVVIVGYTDPQGARTGFGALVLAVWEPREQRFLYIGRAGTGFDTATRTDLLARMKPAARAAVADAPGRFHAVRPELVAEVKFAEWTPAGHLRAPVYLGLRADKPPRECVREVPHA